MKKLLFLITLLSIFLQKEVVAQSLSQLTPLLFQHLVEVSPDSQESTLKKVLNKAAGTSPRLAI